MDIIHGLFFVLSVCALILAAAAAVGQSKHSSSSRILTPHRTMCAGLFLSAVLFFFPLYWDSFALQTGFLARLFKTVLISAHHTIRLFVIDSDFEWIREISEGVASPFLGGAFSCFAALLFILAPVMTFGFILSFFQNFDAYRRLFFHPFADIYVFSELSERSLALASDVKKNHKGAMVLFADVFEQNNEESYEILEKAKGLGALCFKKDVLSLRLRSRSQKSAIRFFLISEDAEDENLKQAMAIANDPAYKQRENLYLYVFSTGAAGELLLSNLSNTKAQVRRIESARSLILYTLDQKGNQLFENATPTDTNEKLISALVIGVGSQGTEMIKALSWYCQMEGYRVEINAFDRDPLAEEKFAHKCPELYSPKCNGIYVEGEAQYKIKIHAGISTDTLAFEEEVKKHKDATYVFVSQGSDDNNIRAALSLRILFARLKKHPVIQAVVYNSATKKALKGAKNADGKEYDLDLIGDLDELYSEAVIINSELEQGAAAIHLKYLSGDMTEEEHMRNLFRYEYNFRSSMASALHGRLRIKRSVPGAGKAEGELTVEERDAIERIEHRRWNAYMRAEGFVYSGSPDKKSRNNLAKMHHNLVPFDVLSEEDKRKDSRVATK